MQVLVEGVSHKIRFNDIPDAFTNGRRLGKTSTMSMVFNQLYGSGKVSTDSPSLDHYTLVAHLELMLQKLGSGAKVTESKVWILNKKNEKIGFTFFGSVSICVGKFIYKESIKDLRPILLDLMIAKSHPLPVGTMWIYFENDLFLADITSKNKIHTHNYDVMDVLIEDDLAEEISSTMSELLGTSKSDIMSVVDCRNEWSRGEYYNDAHI